MYLLLFCLWLILNGSVTLEIVLFGAAITAAIGLLSYALFGYTPKKDLRFLRRIPLFAAYLCVLVFEIVRSNVVMIRLIWRRHRKVQKNLVVFDTDLKTRFGRFLLANSITLTPGTITVRVEENRFTVHCMSRDMIDEINDGALVKLIRKMEA